MEDRRQKLIEDLLKQKAAAVKEFDDKLAKLGYEDGAKPRRSHHRRSAAPSASTPETPTAEKPKAGKPAGAEKSKA